jgi:hypothetical protein
MAQCRTCKSETKGFKCDVCGAESPVHVEPLTRNAIADPIRKPPVGSSSLTVHAPTGLSNQ